MRVSMCVYRTCVSDSVSMCVNVVRVNVRVWVGWMCACVAAVSVCRGPGVWLVCDPREEKSSRLILLDDSGIFSPPWVKD